MVRIKLLILVIASSWLNSCTMHYKNNFRNGYSATHVQELISEDLKTYDRYILIKKNRIQRFNARAEFAFENYYSGKFIMIDELNREQTRNYEKYRFVFSLDVGVGTTTSFGSNGGLETRNVQTFHYVMEDRLKKTKIRVYSRLYFYRICNNLAIELEKFRNAL